MMTKTVKSQSSLLVGQSNCIRRDDDKYDNHDDNFDDIFDGSYDDIFDGSYDDKYDEKI